MTGGAPGRSIADSMRSSLLRHGLPGVAVVVMAACGSRNALVIDAGTTSGSGGGAATSSGVGGASVSCSGTTVASSSGGAGGAGGATVASSSSAGGAGGAGASSSSSGAASSSSGAWDICGPGWMQSCYTALPATLNKGTCHAGVQTCVDGGGIWGPCLGEVTPQPADDCAAMADTDCDGVLTCTCTTWGDLFGYQPAPTSGIPPQLQVGRTVVDAAGNVYVSGHFAGTLDVAGTTLSAPGPNAIYLVKLTSCGAVVWARSFGDASLHASGAYVALDGLGRPVLAGGYSGTADFGGGPLGAATGDGAFVAAFDENGAHRWSKLFAGGGALDVGADGAGVVIAGFFGGTLSFGPGAPALTALDPEDIFLARFNTSDGTPQWSRRIARGLTAMDGFVPYPLALAVSPGGRIYLAGSFSPSIDLGLGQVLAKGDTDAFVAAYDAAGAPVWGKTFGVPSTSTQAWDVTTGADERPVFTGYAGSGFVSAPCGDLGGGPVFPGFGGAYLAALDASGSHLWSRGADPGYQGSDAGPAVAVDLSGNVLWTGIALPAPGAPGIDLGGGPLPGNGVYVGRYGPGGAYLDSTRIFGPQIFSHGVAAFGPDAILATRGYVADLPSGTVQGPSAFVMSLIVGKLPL